MNKKLPTATRFESILELIENNKPLRVVPMFAPNIMDIPKTFDNNFVSYILWAKAMVVDDDWMMKDDMIPDNTPKIGFSNFVRISLIKTSSKEFKRMFSIELMLKNINPIYIRKELSCFLFKKRRIIAKTKKQ